LAANIIGLIPARYASTRFPAKPLVDIGGKSMIQRVYEQAKKSTYLSKVVVATDNPEIYNHVKSFDGEVCMTREDHISGTDRCHEALTLQSEQFEYVINIQGDEPFIQPEQIDLLAAVLTGKTEIATLIKAIDQTEQLFNPNLVKAVIGKNCEALYFSRSPIPYLRNIKESDWVTHHTFFKHIGMYAYRVDILAELTKLHPSILEKAESLEQLRVLENGYRIRVCHTEHRILEINNSDELARAQTTDFESCSK